MKRSTDVCWCAFVCVRVAARLGSGLRTRRSREIKYVSRLSGQCRDQISPDKEIPNNTCIDFLINVRKFRVRLLGFGRGMELSKARSICDAEYHRRSMCHAQRCPCEPMQSETPCRASHPPWHNSHSASMVRHCHSQDAHSIGSVADYSESEAMGLIQSTNAVLEQAEKQVYRAVAAPRSPR
jgi:hypothetical protein